MKKSFLLLTVLIMSAVSSYAVDWKAVDTNIPNLSLYVDKDSIKYINPAECLYAIKFQAGTKPEQIAYIKSNSSNNTVGVIKSAGFDEENYCPKAVFANTHVFMKPVEDDSFLSFAHNYVLNPAAEETTAEYKTKSSGNEVVLQVDRPVLRGENEIKLVSYESRQALLQKETSAENLEEYAAEVAKELKANWQPPKSGRKTQSIIILQIGEDGSLQNYKFVEQSGDKLTDRSIISAAEKTVPYIKFPQLERTTRRLNLQFVFNYKLIKKSVK